MLTLNWTQNRILIRGLTSAGGWVDGQVNQGVIFPGTTTQAQQVTLSSSAFYDDPTTVLTNIKLYLDGNQDELDVIQGIWSSQGGGVQISFDGGKSYLTFSTTCGYKQDASTWILLPSSAIGIDKTAGQLGALDSAKMLVRCSIPANCTQYRVYLPVLAADCDAV